MTAHPDNIEEEFFLHHCVNMLTPEVYAAMIAAHQRQSASDERLNINQIARICRKHGARLAPIAASLGWLQAKTGGQDNFGRYVPPSRVWIDLCEDTAGNPVVHRSDRETLAALALFRTASGTHAPPEVQLVT